MYARLVHRNLSQAEVEVLFNLLSERFEVVEEMIRDEGYGYDEEVVFGWDEGYEGISDSSSSTSSKGGRVDSMLMSILSIDLPLQYDVNFVKDIGFERWEALKEIIKNIRWRRGKGVFAFRLRFLGSQTIVFSIVYRGSGKVLFNKAIEGIEYVADTMPFRSLPDAKEIRFVFSREEMRWRPRSAYIDGKEYRYVEGRWNDNIR
ncbi:hypothetical protein HRbin04_00912 [archaeon HR04]|nr:hypothetical protein HRbin04_00912 [archaeon HR04]